MSRISDLNGMLAEDISHSTQLLYLVEYMERVTLAEVGVQVWAAIDRKYGRIRNLRQDGWYPGQDLNRSPSD
jgi:hypothetical protein